MFSKTALLLLLTSLGYFVDIFDLFLFSVLRTPSLRSMGLPPDEVLKQGMFILNCQMGGLLIGSLFWGILGDKKGRLKTLYGSILIYSLATLANAFVTSPLQYAIVRLIAGIGLAGELGASVTLVTETLSKEKRGLGTTILAGVGLSGGIFAATVAQYLSWRNCYILGAVLGFALLLLRMKLLEPALFLKQPSSIKKGSLKLLFSDFSRGFKYLKLILIGLPIWYVAGILIVFSPEIAKNLNIQGDPVTAAKAVFYSYLGVTLGDFACGFLSQKLRSRKKTIFIFMCGVILLSAIYLNAPNISTYTFYWLCFFIGFATGYWAVIITLAAESFGTNLRSTAATTIPNLIRAGVIPMTLGLQFFMKQNSLIVSASYLGALIMVLALFSLFATQETFTKDLDYIEK